MALCNGSSAWGTERSRSVRPGSDRLLSLPDHLTLMLLRFQILDIIRARRENAAGHPR